MPEKSGSNVGILFAYFLGTTFDCLATKKRKQQKNLHFFRNLFHVNNLAGKKLFFIAFGFKKYTKKK